MGKGYSHSHLYFIAVEYIKATIEQFFIATKNPNSVANPFAPIPYPPGPGASHYFFNAFSGFFANALHHLIHSLAALCITNRISSFVSVNSHCSSSL